MSNENYIKIAQLIDCASGEIVGRTRLQKIVYLLTAAGLDSSFDFAYKHYGPYSEELAQSAREAVLLGYIAEDEKVAGWGGTYSVYKKTNQLIDAHQPIDETMIKFVDFVAGSNAIELELAATAVFLFKEGIRDPWEETARRKPEKADSDRLQKAKELYAKIKEFKLPKPLPNIV